MCPLALLGDFTRLFTITPAGISSALSSSPEAPFLSPPPEPGGCSSALSAAFCSQFSRLCAGAAILPLGPHPGRLHSHAAHVTQAFQGPSRISDLAAFHSHHVCQAAANRCLHGHGVINRTHTIILATSKAGTSGRRKVRITESLRTLVLPRAGTPLTAGAHLIR